MLALVEFTGNKDSNYWETNTRENDQTGTDR